MGKGVIRLVQLGALAAALILSAACSSSPTGGTDGNVRFVLGGGSTTAATALGEPAPTILNDDQGGDRTIASATITITGIVARNVDGELVDVTIDLPATVDLIGLAQGHTVDLPIGSLPVGSYDQLVVVIRSLHLVLSDGTQIDVTPPGGGWTAIVPTQPFDVVDGQITTVTLRFRAANAFRWMNGQVEFHPDFDCSVDD